MSTSSFRAFLIARGRSRTSSLDGADVGLEIDSKGRLNLAELIERLRDPNEPESPPPRMILERVLIREGSVGLLDLSRERATAKVVPLNLQLTGVSTLRDSKGGYELTATLPGGGSLAWKGSVSLEPLASSGEFNMRGLQLATAWRFLRDELSIAEPRGALALAGRYDAAYDKGKGSAAVEAFQAELSGLSLGLAGGASPLIALEKIRIDDARFSLATRELVVPKLELSTGSVTASIAKDGTLDWERIGKPAAAEPPRGDAQAAAPDTQPWRVRVERIGVEKVALNYADASRSPELQVRASALSGALGLDVTTGAGPPRIVAHDIQIAVNGTSVLAPAPDAAAATLDALTLTGGRVDVAERIVSAKALTLTGGGVKVERGPDGPVGLSARAGPTERCENSVRARAEGPRQEGRGGRRVALQGGLGRAHAFPRRVRRSQRETRASVRRRNRLGLAHARRQREQDADRLRDRDQGRATRHDQSHRHAHAGFRSGKREDGGSGHRARSAEAARRTLYRARLEVGAPRCRCGRRLPCGRRNRR